MRYAIPALAAFFLLALVAGLLANRPLISAATPSAVYADSAVKTARDDGWRRTATGWERTSDWKSIAPDERTLNLQKLHPLIGAAMLFLVSVGILVAGNAWRAEREENPGEATLGK